MDTLPRLLPCLSWGVGDPSRGVERPAAKRGPGPLDGGEGSGGASPLIRRGHCRDLSIADRPFLKQEWPARPCL